MDVKQPVFNRIQIFAKDGSSFIRISHRSLVDRSWAGYMGEVRPLYHPVAVAIVHGQPYIVPVLDEAPEDWQAARELGEALWSAYGPPSACFTPEPVTT